jgi:hypothetical protein
MGENSASLSRQWGYSPPPGQQPEHDTEKTEKQNNHKHAALDPFCSVELLLREVLSAGVLVICAAGDAGPDMAALRVRHLQRLIRKAADSDNVLLEQPGVEDKLSMIVKEVRKGLEKVRRLARTRSWLSAWCQSVALSVFFFLLHCRFPKTQW